MGTAGLTASCSPVTYVNATRDGQSMIVNKEAWGETDFVLVRNQALPAPIYLRKKEAGYLAVLLECTHKQCEVRPGSNSLKCPCHGSEFNRDGQVTEGPAERDLHSFKVTDDDLYIYIT